MVWTLKTIGNYFLGHFGAIFGYLKIIRFGYPFYWTTIVTQSFTMSNSMTLLHQKVGEPPQKCPKMAVLGSFFGPFLKVTLVELWEYHH